MKKKTASKTGISRRAFGRATALAAAAAALAEPPKLFAQEKPEPPPPHQDQALSSASQADVETRYAQIVKQYGSRLSEDEKADIRRILTEAEKGVDALRAFHLDNADEPATVLHIGRGEDSHDR